MKDPKVIWAWVGVAIVAIAIVAGVVWHFISQPKPPTGPVAVHVPQGQLVAGFPRELLLDDVGQISNSYSVNYSSSTNQYTAEWNSSSSLVFVDKSYETYLKNNGWTITNQANFSTMNGIYATSASSVINIVITSQGKGSKVMISYLSK